MVLICQHLSSLFEIPNLFSSLNFMTNSTDNSLCLWIMLHVGMVNWELCAQDLALLFISHWLHMLCSNIHTLHHNLTTLPVHFGNLSNLSFIASGNHFDHVSSLDMEVQQHWLAILRQLALLPILSWALHHIKYMSIIRIPWIAVCILL